jgi:hypothetical protein
MIEHRFTPRRPSLKTSDDAPVWDPLDPDAAEVVEVPLLLAGWQVSALEKEAHDRGLTAGEMVRQLLSEFIHTRLMPEDTTRAGAF